MNTTQFGVEVAIIKAKGTAPAAGDLYGGSNTPTFGVGSRVLVSEPNIESAPNMLDDESTNGSQFMTGQDIAFIPTKISGTHEMRVIGSGLMMYLALGYDSLQGPLASGTKHAHLILIDPKGKDQVKFSAAEILQDPTITANDYKNRFFHFLRRDGMGNEIARNATIKEFTLACEQKSALKLEFTGSAQDYVLDKTFAQDTASTLPATRAEMKRFRFSDQQATGCFIGKWNEAGDTLTQAKECLLGWSIQQTYGQAEGVATSCSGLYQAEPVADGWNELTVELTRYKVDTYDWLESMTAGTEVAFKTKFAVGDYSVTICIPRMKINNVQHQLGDGGKIVLTCKALIADKTNDPFLVERTIGATPMTIPFDTAMYAIVVDDQEDNYMRVN